MFCAFLIIQNTKYHRALFFNSSNVLAANIIEFSDNIGAYFYLKRENQSLVEENMRLRNQLSPHVSSAESTVLLKDSVKLYKYIAAKVINNSVDKRNNTLTINLGLKDGITEEMGVIGESGVVGKIRNVSNSNAVVTSLLHSNILISAVIKDKVNLCTVEWNGINTDLVDIKYVPRHYQIDVGDSIFTSGYSSIFPEGVLIGTVANASISEEATFYNISVKLVNDFRKIDYVYVVQHMFKQEIDSLNTMIEDE